MLAGLSLFLLATQASAPQPIDIASWIGPDDYPQQARRAGIEGRVFVELQIDEAGRVADCTAVNAEGTEMLARATCDAMRTRGRFHPARDADGRVVSARTRQMIQWELLREPLNSFDRVFDVTTVDTTDQVRCEHVGSDADSTAPSSAFVEDCGEIVSEMLALIREQPAGPLILAQRFSAGDRPPVGPRPAQADRLLTELFIDFVVTPEGRSERCKVDISDGPLVPVGPCDRLPMFERLSENAELELRRGSLRYSLWSREAE